MKQKLNREMEYQGEVTLGDIITGVRSYFSVIWSHIWWVIVAAIVVGLAFGVDAYFKVPTYRAELTFMVNEDEGGALNGVSAILGQFGFGGSSTKHNLSRVLELARSRRIVQEVLFDSVSIQGNTDNIANHILTIYEFRDKWESEPDLRDFSFQAMDLLGQDTTTNKALQAVYGRVRGTTSNGTDGLFVIEYNDESGIFEMVVETRDPKVSTGLAVGLYNYLSKFYIDKTIEKHSDTYRNISSRVDSIFDHKSAVENELAFLEDQSTSVYSRHHNLRIKRLSERQQMLTIMYAEAMKNRETASFLLDSAKPYFQIIDLPLQPLERISVSKIRRFILGSAIGGIFVILVLIFLEVIKRHL